MIDDILEIFLEGLLNGFDLSRSKPKKRKNKNNKKRQKKKRK